jgi:hypothetical protein
MPLLLLSSIIHQSPSAFAILETEYSACSALHQRQQKKITYSPQEVKKGTKEKDCSQSEGC